MRPVDHYPQLLLAALRTVAPSAEEQATVVVWTPGPHNSAYFEHAFLARQMGVELVEASDLVVRDSVLYMRTTSGLERVHAVYRRLDDDFVDPLEFRPDSLLGVPGLLRAYRAGTVAIANAFGTGVADDKAVYHYVPRDDPLLPRRGADPRQRPDLPAGRPRAAASTPCRGWTSWSSSRPASRAARASASGPRPRAEELAALAAVIRAQPGRWIAQEVVRLSTVPTVQPDGSLAPRHVDLRPFAVFGETIKIVPGGLDARRA